MEGTLVGNVFVFVLPFEMLLWCLDLFFLPFFFALLEHIDLFFLPFFFDLLEHMKFCS